MEHLEDYWLLSRFLAKFKTMMRSLVLLLFVEPHLARNKCPGGCGRSMLCDPRGERSM